uniref:Putative trypsin-like serine protease n=1 Tax=Culex tarsalis TaxID=7177 RepID=A0A1Q3FR26_CULTA
MMPNERQSLDDCHLRYYKYGLRDYVTGPIFNETKSASKEFAHLAAVGQTRNDGTVRWTCGGSLIWENYVLTSVRCTNVNGVGPNVVRLGDTEQVEIYEIIIHPSFNRDLPAYYDVALLKLERNVTFSATTAPACLWKDENVPFPNVEAVGWKNLDDLSPSKATLRQVGSSTCNRTLPSGLSDGVKDHQLCVRHDKLDQCPIGLGSPLHKELIHNGKMTPFLVGIASVDSTCDSSNPAVYSKVSYFYDWIEKTLDEKEPNFREWRMNPVGCAFLRSYLRDHENEVIVGETNDAQTLDASRAHVSYASREFNHVVGIHWQNYAYRRENCTGTLISDDTVLVLAECTSNFGVAATHVYIGWLLNTENYPIAETHLHPEYIDGSPYNNIAILKLGKRIRFSPVVRPACIWTTSEIPSRQVDVLARGRTDINFFVRDEQFESFWPMDTNLTARLDVNSVSNCSLTLEARRKLNHGLTGELLCTGNSNFLVPGSCGILPGAPAQLPIERMDRYFYYALALNQFGSNCGFGEPIVSTRIATHLNWLQTILLPNYQDEAAAVQYVNPDWVESEPCTYDFEDEVGGVCTQISKCPKVWNDFKAKRRVHFCNSASVVCCPKRYIVKEGQKTSDDLDTCPKDFTQNHKTVGNPRDLREFPYIVSLNWSNSPKRCLASLITTQFVLTAASCATSSPGNPTHAILADKTSVPLVETTVHPNYRPSEIVDDLAILKLRRAVIPSNKIFPVCIWMNLTHTPLNLMLISEGQTSPSTRQMAPMYNADCQRDYKQKLTADHLCADQLAIETRSTCNQVGDQLVWYDPQGNQQSDAMPYLIGFHSYGERCEDGNPGVFTRIAHYMDWIRQRL